MRVVWANPGRGQPSCRSAAPLSPSLAVEVDVPAAPEPVKQLSWAKTYTFKLRWDEADRAYRVTQVRLGGRVIHEMTK